VWDGFSRAEDGGVMNRVEDFGHPDDVLAIHELAPILVRWLETIMGNCTQT